MATRTGLVKSTPYYAFAEIPRQTYRTVNRPITTFGVVATLVTSADVHEKDVYELTRAVMECIDDFRQLHPALATFVPKCMVVDGLSSRCIRAHKVLSGKELGSMKTGYVSPPRR